jgi:hypothetical protein
VLLAITGRRRKAFQQVIHGLPEADRLGESIVSGQVSHSLQTSRAMLKCVPHGVRSVRADTLINDNIVVKGSTTKQVDGGLSPGAQRLEQPS